MSKKKKSKKTHENETPAQLRERLKQESIQMIKDHLEEGVAPVDEDRPEDDKDARYGYMCSVDFDHELGHAYPYTEVYPSIPTLWKQRKCCTGKGSCGIVRVKVTLDKTIREYDFRREKK